MLDQVSSDTEDKSEVEGVKPQKNEEMEEVEPLKNEECVVTTSDVPPLEDEDETDSDPPRSQSPPTSDSSLELDDQSEIDVFLAGSKGTKNMNELQSSFVVGSALEPESGYETFDSAPNVSLFISTVRVKIF